MNLFFVNLSYFGVVSTYIVVMCTTKLSYFSIIELLFTILINYDVEMLIVYYIYFYTM